MAPSVHDSLNEIFDSKKFIGAKSRQLAQAKYISKYSFQTKPKLGVSTQSVSVNSSVNIEEKEVKQAGLKMLKIQG